MAYEHDHQRNIGNPMDYQHVSESRISSRGILIAIGAIALIIAALIALAPTDTSGLRDISGTVPPATVPATPQPQTAPAAPAQ